MNTDTLLLTHLEACLADLPRPLFLALSGGMDSMLLLEAVSRLTKDFTVIHVHHGLQREADAWAAFCQSQAQRRDVAFVCEKVALEAGGNVEARARAARYDVFAKRVEQGSLLLAHHQDDQAETFLLRLMRGAGAQGLGGMAALSRQHDMTLARPLLHWSRAAIAQQARDWQLEWIDDPSNDDPRFERNWLRHALLPLWQQHQPDIKTQVARSADLLNASAELQDDLARLDVERLDDGQSGWSLAALGELSVARRHNLLRYWLADKEPYRPGVEVLLRLQQEVFDAAADKQPQLPLEKGVLTRYRQRLYWVPKILFDAPPDGCHWQLGQPLQLGALEIGDRPQFSLAHQEKKSGSVPYLVGQLQLPATLTELEVRFAQGGERLLRNGQHQQVSEIWRAAGVPPWIRKWLPLFYVQDELVAAAAIGVADNWRTEQEVIMIDWQLSPSFTASTEQEVQ